MSRSLRLALAIAAIGLFLCCVAGLGATLLGTRLFGRAFITNPERVRAVGHEIADYEVPPGFQEMVAMNVMGLKMVAIGPKSPSNYFTIVLVHLPVGMRASQEEIVRQLEQAMARQTGLDSAEMTSESQQETMINGAPVTLKVREGNTRYGVRLRQISGRFEANAGAAMVMISGEVDTWDQALVERFMASLH